MGRKIQATKASLVAAFLAASGGAIAKTLVNPTPAPAAVSATGVAWGDQLVRFIKLDGFPAFYKSPDSAALENFYKPQLIESASSLYLKYGDAVNDVLALYQKADGGPLTGILSGLETYWKVHNIQPLLDYLKAPGAMDAYFKFQTFFSALQSVSPEGGAFDFFVKVTGIQGDPLNSGELT
jgi:hypothetical protein